MNEELEQIRETAYINWKFDRVFMTDLSEEKSPVDDAYIRWIGDAIIRTNQNKPIETLEVK